MSRWRSLSTFLLWSPAALGVTYLAVFLWKLPRLIDRLYWDSDAAVALVIADTHNRGTTILGHYGWFTNFWFTQITRPLPFHREIWEYMPYVVFLATMALLSWISWRVAGAWAAAMTATAAVSVSPFLAYVAASINFHSTTWAGTAVLAGFAFWLCRQESDARKAIGTLVMAFFAGFTLASDHLSAVTALIPLAGAGVLVLLRRESRVAGGAMVTVALAAIPIALLTEKLMHRLHFEVWSAEGKLAASSQRRPNLERFVDLLAVGTRGSDLRDPPVGIRGALIDGSEAVFLLCLAVPFLLLVRELLTRDKSAARIAYCGFWAVSIAATAGAYVLSTFGSQPGYYLIAIYYAVAATLPLLSALTPRLRPVATICVGILALTNLITLLDTKTALHGGEQPIAAIAGQVLEIAQRENAMKGYADYWESSSLSWSSDMKLQVYAVTQCRSPALDLCPFWVNVSTNWYKESQGKSFLLRDTKSMSVKEPPPEKLGEPTSIHMLGPSFTLYVYPYDISRHFDYSDFSPR